VYEDTGRYYRNCLSECLHVQASTTALADIGEGWGDSWKASRKPTQYSPLCLEWKWDKAGQVKCRQYETCACEQIVYQRSLVLVMAGSCAGVQERNTGKEQSTRTNCKRDHVSL